MARSQTEMTPLPICILEYSLRSILCIYGFSSVLNSCRRWRGFIVDFIIDRKVLFEMFSFDVIATFQCKLNLFILFDSAELCIIACYRGVQNAILE